MSVLKAGAGEALWLLLLCCTVIFLWMWGIYCCGDKHEDQPFLSSKTYQVYEHGQKCTWPTYKWHKSYNRSDHFLYQIYTLTSWLKWIIKKKNLINQRINVAQSGWAITQISVRNICSWLHNWMDTWPLNLNLLYALLYKLLCVILILHILFFALIQIACAGCYHLASLWTEISFENWCILHSTNVDAPICWSGDSFD